MKSYTHFILGESLRGNETRHIEFKEIKGTNPCSSIVNTADEYAVAFLNSEGGRIYWGIRDTDKVVVGVELTKSESDRLQRDVTNKLSEIQPQLDPGRYKLTLHCIVNAGSNLVVVELEVPAGNSAKPFYTGGHACFVRLDGVKKKLSGQQLTDWIIRRVTSFRPSSDNDPLAPGMLELAHRIRRVFSEHGLQPAHLTRFFAIRKAPFVITLADQQNDASFFRWLSDEKIDWIAQAFLVRRAWIDGEDTAIHEQFSFDKQPQHFFSTISQHLDASVFEEVHDSPYAYFLRWGVGKDWQKKGQSRVFVVLAVPLARFSNEHTVYKYITDFEGYPWEYTRTYIQLRSWIRLLNIGKKIYCFGRELTVETAEEFQSNNTFLRAIIENKLQRTRDDWHPEDYALYPSESSVAKETETLGDVIAFLKENNLPCEETRFWKQ